MKNSNKKNKGWKNWGLYALIGVVLITLGTIFWEGQPQVQGEWRYSRLLAEVQKKPPTISRIFLSPDRTYAEVSIPDADRPEGRRRIRINLPNDPEFVKILQANNIEIEVLPRRNEGALFQTLSSFILPVLLILGLFFLLRRAQVGQEAKP